MNEQTWTIILYHDHGCLSAEGGQMHIGKQLQLQLQLQIYYPVNFNMLYETSISSPIICIYYKSLCIVRGSERVEHPRAPATLSIAHKCIIP